MVGQIGYIGVYFVKGVIFVAVLSLTYLII